MNLLEKLKRLADIAKACDVPKLVIGVNEIINSYDFALSEQRGWVDVKEKPRYYQPVNVMYDGKITTAWLASDGDNYMWTIHGSYDIIHNVTHWMPLPAPPITNK